MNTGPESETARHLATCSRLLKDRDFTTCREYAFRVPRSDPETSTSVDQVLAIIDVLLAANRRAYGDLYDWYSILQISREDAEDSQLIKEQFKKFLLLLNPIKNKFAFASEAFALVRQAWSVLWDPVKRTQYNKEIDSAKERSCNHRQEVEDTCGDDDRDKGADQDITFWTMCPYCWVLYEYEKDYVECCLVCQNCKRFFHGVEVNPPLRGMLVNGKEQYSCCYAYFPLRYSKFPNVGLNKNSNLFDEKGKGIVDEECDKFYVEISDDEEDGPSNVFQVGKQDKDFNLKKDGLCETGQVEGLREAGMKNTNEKSENQEVILGNARKSTDVNGKRGMRVKSVPLYSKKIVGNRRRDRKIGSRNDEREGYSNTSVEYDTE